MSRTREWSTAADPRVAALEDTINDMATNLFYYDRKEDEELPVGAIEELLESGAITKEWLVQKFAAAIGNV